MKPGRMLIAGIGNMFLGDDGFGVEVAGRLATADLPDWVEVADYGISGMHLAYDLANGYESAILIDAAPRGGVPGTVYVIEPERPGARAGRAEPACSPAGWAEPASAAADAAGALFDAHGMQPDVVLGVLDLLGARAGRMLIVGCEPAALDHGIGLSEPVAAAVDEAVRVVLELVAAGETDSERADETQSPREGTCV